VEWGKGGGLVVGGGGGGLDGDGSGQDCGGEEKRRKLAEYGGAVRALQARRGDGKKSTKFFSVVSREGPSPSERP